MDKGYLVLELAHPIRGRVKQIRITHRLLTYVLGTTLVVALLIFGLFASYLRMSWKVANYDDLRANFERLRGRYQELQRQSRQHTEQMASLETLATEISAAYGINSSAPKSGSNPASVDSLEPKATESIEEYNFLKAASFSGIYHHFAHQWQLHTRPCLWPVNGTLRSSFGGRTDPFSGEGAFHTGVDLQASKGTPVHVTADGVVVSAHWSGSYGKLVVVDHGNGLQTYYAHLSQFLVVPGEDVRLGQVIAFSGGTGRATSPHLHYEIRLDGTPVNPYRYLAKSTIPRETHGSRSDLGL